MTLRQLYLRIAGARGHSQIVGTPAQIADEMEARFQAHVAVDFNITPPILPGRLDDFIALALPKLRRRDLFRDTYDVARCATISAPDHYRWRLAPLYES